MNAMRLILKMILGLSLGVFGACGVKGPPVPYIEAYPEVTAPTTPTPTALPESKAKGEPQRKK